MPLQRSGSDKWVYYTNPEYGCHREFRLKLERFWRWEPLRQWPLVISIQGNLDCMAASADANPLKPAHLMPFPLETVFAQQKIKDNGRLTG